MACSRINNKKYIKEVTTKFETRLSIIEFRPVRTELAYHGGHDNIREDRIYFDATRSQ